MLSLLVVTTAGDSPVLLGVSSLGASSKLPPGVMRSLNAGIVVGAGMCGEWPFIEGWLVGGEVRGGELLTGDTAACRLYSAFGGGSDV